MRALQALVIIMGLLIVAGVAVIGTTIAMRATQQRDAPKGLPAFGDVQLALPPGGRVVWVSADDGRLVIHVQGGAEAARFEILDLATGGRLGTVRVSGDAPR